MPALPASDRVLMKVVAESRQELWVSIAVVIVAVSLCRMPVGFFGVLLLSSAMIIGLLCAVNAVLAIDEMGLFERAISVLWLISMVILTPFTLYWAATIRDFANK